jgi:hypothetical protein
MRNITLLYGNMKNAMNRFGKKGGKCLAFVMFLLFLTLGANANPVDRVRARQVATTFLNNNGARSVELTEVSSIAGFSNVFVFTTESSFVLVSADDCVQPILGYSLTGRFDFENMPDNKRAWIQGYCDEIRYAIDNQVRASSEVTQQWRDLMEGHLNTGRAITVVAPLTQTQWNQSSPYNMLCPGGSVTGCVATAMAQIMKYWNYPEHGIGSHSYTHATYGELSADFQSTYYDWANMTNTYNYSSTETQKLAVATLMYHCGVSVNMNYSPNSSGAGNAIVAEALKIYFNYSSETVFHNRSEYSDNNWITMLKNDLNLNRPVWYCGSGSGGGHAFVFDGYNSSNYFHVNWGWGGYCDEYYTINNLNPGPGGIGSGSNGIYNDGQGAVFGIRPSECTANAPSNLTYTQNGRNVTLSWSAATGASSYKVYRDNSFIGNTTSTSFTDTAPFGSSVYYVRSVDSQGRLSLSSNAVTVTVEYLTPVVDDLAATVNGNNVNLTWSAPDWCYPATPTATMTYGSGDYTGMALGYHDGTTCLYWGHRYTASTLSSYNNMKVYKVSFYANETGAYQVYVYKGTTSGHPQTQLLQQSFSVGSTGWFDIDLSIPIQIDASKDLWVFVYDPEARNYPATYCSYSGSEGNYYATNPMSWVGTWDNAAFLIRTYVSDGTYTYNVYRNESCIANHVTSTNYSDNNLSTGVYNYYVKTNYYAGETAASNQVSVQIGSGTLYTISASATPSIGGTVTGMGSYFSGQTCTLRAIANEGFYFVNWTKNGAVVSTNATYSFAVTGNATYVANFNSTDLHVFADYYPDANNPNSQYVRVYWTGPGSAKDDPTKTDRSTYCIYRAHCDGSGEELIAENVTGNQYIDNGWSALAGGSYKYGVSMADRGSHSTEIQWNDSQVALNGHTIDVVDFVPSVVNNDTHGDSSPMNHRDGWLYYDNGSYATSVGAGGTICWGAMFPASMLTENRLTKVALYENSNNSGSITLNICSGGNTAPGTLLYSLNFTPVGGNAFHEITLSSPVTIDPTQNLWITFCQSGDTYPANACTDTGNANNRWVSFDGNSWYDLANSGLSGYGWMIRAYVEEVSEIVWSDCIEKPSAVQQNISLDSGWNWFSSNVDITLDDLKSALVAAVPGTSIKIKSQSNGSTSYNGSTWRGALNSLDVSQMYMISVSTNCEITLTGMPINPAEHPVAINNGVNWIAFPLGENMTLDNAFAGFAVSGDKVKSQTTTGNYNGTLWRPNFSLEPGKGYMYISNTQGTRTFTFPIDAK